MFKIEVFGVEKSEDNFYGLGIKANEFLEEKKIKAISITTTEDKENYYLILLYEED